MAYPAPSGRELAIEALLDREPNGDAYRVSRVLVRGDVMEHDSLKRNGIHLSLTLFFCLFILL